MKRIAFLAACCIAAPAFACKWLVLNDAWVRPSAGPNAAAYVSIDNTDPKDEAILGVSSDCCKAVELHTVQEEDGIMRMRRMDQLALPAGETVTLKPGGMHLMLIGLKQPLEAGDEVVLTFDFERAHDKIIAFPVSETRLPGPAKSLKPPHQ